MICLQRPRLLAALAAALALACAGDPPPPPPGPGALQPPDPAALHLAGTGAMTPLMEQLAAAYAAQGAPRPVLVHESIGSGGGVRATADGAVDLGLMSRRLTDAERALPLIEVPLGRDAVALAAHPATRATGLTAAEVRALYASATAGAATLPDGTPAVVLLRDRTESANLALDLAVPGLAQVREAAYERRRLRVLYHDSAMAEALASTPGALGVLPLQLARSHRPPLKVLALDGVHPSPETLADGSFRATRHLGLVLRPDRRGRVAPFLGFLASPRGQALIREAGVLPAAPSPGAAAEGRP